MSGPYKDLLKITRPLSMAWIILLIGGITVGWWVSQEDPLQTNLVNRPVPIPPLESLDLTEQKGEQKGEQKESPQKEVSAPPGSAGPQEPVKILPLPVSSSVAPQAPEQKSLALPVTAVPLDKTPKVAAGTEEVKSSISSEIGGSKKPEGGDTAALPDVPLESSLPPFKVHSRAFSSKETRPKIAIIMTGLGPSRGLTLRAIQELPPEVTLAFVPYTQELPSLMRQARSLGHEVLMMVPMEPESYPRRDPGPRTLLTGDLPAKNLERLRGGLARGREYIGVIDFMGSRFTSSETDMRPILESLYKQGLMFFDSGINSRTTGAAIAESLKMPYVKNTHTLDLDTAKIPLDEQLTDVEKTAKKFDQASVTAFIYPMAIDRILGWIPTLKEKGIVLAPLSALIKQDKKLAAGSNSGSVPGSNGSKADSIPGAILPPVPPSTPTKVS